jgi:hypothetical protein
VARPESDVGDQTLKVANGAIGKKSLSSRAVSHACTTARSSGFPGLLELAPMLLRARIFMTAPRAQYLPRRRREEIGERLFLQPSVEPFIHFLIVFLK